MNRSYRDRFAFANCCKIDTTWKRRATDEQRSKRLLTSLCGTLRSVCCPWRGLCALMPMARHIKASKSISSSRRSIMREIWSFGRYAVGHEVVKATLGDGRTACAEIHRKQSPIQGDQSIVVTRVWFVNDRPSKYTKREKDWSRESHQSATAVLLIAMASMHNKKQSITSVRLQNVEMRVFVR
jgi:hypothetical protein